MDNEMDRRTCRIPFPQDEGALGNPRDAWGIWGG